MCHDQIKNKCLKIALKFLAIATVALIALSCPVEVVYTAEFLVERRIEGNPNLTIAQQSLSTNGRRLFDAIAQRSDALGRILSADETREMLLAFDLPLDPDDCGHLIHLLFGIQRPQISPDELSELYRAERQSLMEKLRLQYTVSNITELVPDGKPQETQAGATEECMQILDGEKLLIAKRIFRGNILDREVSLSFDGALTRSKIHLAGSIANLSIHDAGHRRRSYFDIGSPIVNAKLIDRNLDLEGGFLAGLEDISEFASKSIIFEQLVEISGHICQPIGNFENMCYCIPQYGYAVLRAEQGIVRFNSQTGKFYNPDSHVELTNESFENVVDDAWLPGRTELRGIFRNNVIQHIVSELKSAHKEELIDPASFVLTVDNTGFVFDKIQNAIATADANQLKRSMSVKYGRSFWILTINGVGFLLIGVFAARNWLHAASRN